MATNPVPAVPTRIIDLDKLANKRDGHLIRALMLEILNDLTTIATKLDGESTLTNKNYVSGILTKFR